MQTLDVGELATIETDWYDGDHQAAEPSAITLTIHPPSGADIVKAKADMTGSESGALAGTDDRWSWGQVATLAGVWRYDVVGTVDGAEVALPSGIYLVGAGGRSGPCEPWATWEEVEACDGHDFTALDAAQREAFLDKASGILYDLTERRYPGVCTTTRSLCLSCAACGPAWCSCSRRDRLDLGSPVWGVWDVTVDGAVLDPSAYQLRDRRWLYRLDGRSWPRGSDVTDPDAFAASWAYGRRVPEGGRGAAAMFAGQLGRSCLRAECQLAERVSTVTREGVVHVVIDSMKMVAEGRTGLYFVDLWLEADRRGRRARPGIFAPGAHGTTRSRA